MPDSNDHWSIKDILGGTIGGMLLCALGLWMLVLPNARDDQPAKDSVKIIGKLLDLIWSTTGGIALLILGITIMTISIYKFVTQLNTPSK